MFVETWSVFRFDCNLITNSLMTSMETTLLQCKYPFTALNSVDTLFLGRSSVSFAFIAPRPAG